MNDRNKRSRSRDRNSETGSSLLISLPEALIKYFTGDFLDSTSESSEVQNIKLVQHADSPEPLLSITDLDLQKCLQAFRSILDMMARHSDFDLSSQGVRILIPREMVPFIIGKRGKQIKKIQDISYTQISVRDQSFGSDQKVKITGRPYDIQTAVHHILRLIRERGNSQATWTAPQHPPSKEKSHVRFIVPKSCVGFLIGKDGRFIKNMKTKHSVNIKILPGEKRQLVNNQHISVLSGQKQNCQKAIPDFIEKICEAMDTDFNDANIRILVPLKQTQRITENFIDGLEMEHSVRIKLMKDEDTHPDAIVSVEGSFRAKSEVIMAIFKEIEQETPISPKRSGPAPSSKPSISVTVPDNMVARLIGKNGDHVRKMIDSTGCLITFHKQHQGVNTPTGERARLCTLQGTTMAISMASKLILEEIIKLERA